MSLFASVRRACGFAGVPATRKSGGNPPIGLVPFESVETRDGGRMRILDAKGEARFAANYVHVESADGEVRRKLVFVRFGAQSLWFCRSAGDKEIRRESPGWRIQRDGFAFEVKDGEMSRSGSEMDFVVRCGADGIFARLEPFQTGEGKPAVRLEKVCFMCFAPVGVLFFPRIFLRGCSRGQQCEQKSTENQAGRTIPEAHERVYRERKNAENEDRARDYLDARFLNWKRIGGRQKYSPPVSPFARKYTPRRWKHAG